MSSCVELCHVAELLLSLRKRASLPLLFLSLSLSLNRRGRDDKRFQVTRKSVTCFPLEKKGKRKKKRKARNINSMRGSWLKSGVATRMLSAPILICSLSPARIRIRAEKFKEYSNLGPAFYTHTHTQVCVCSSFLPPSLYAPRRARTCVEQFTPTRSAAANSVYFHTPSFLFRALLKTVERWLEIREACYMVASSIYIPLFKNLRMNFGTDFDGDFFPRLEEVSLRFWERFWNRI